MKRILIVLALGALMLSIAAEAREMRVFPISAAIEQPSEPTFILANNTLLANSAYTILEDLATKRRNERVFGGLSTVAGGLITGWLLGMSLGEISEEAGFYGFWVPAGIGIALGGITLLVPTEPEREFNAVQNLVPGAREAASAEALQRMSEKAFVARMVDGAIKAATAVASLIFLPENDILPYTRVISFASGIGSAVLTFLVPTEEERAYQRYLRLSGA